jgi:hypothetical protein
MRPRQRLCLIAKRRSSPSHSPEIVYLHLDFPRHVPSPDERVRVAEATNTDFGLVLLLVVKPDCRRPR